MRLATASSLRPDAAGLPRGVKAPVATPAMGGDQMIALPATTSDAAWHGCAMGHAGNAARRSRPYLFGDADVRDFGFEVQHAVAQVLQLLVFLQHSWEFDR